jgi:hypothetical protein
MNNSCGEKAILVGDDEAGGTRDAGLDEIAEEVIGDLGDAIMELNNE